MKALQYPIDLYVPNKNSLISMLIMLAMIWLGGYAISTGLSSNDWVFAGLGLCCVAMGLYFLIIGLITWFIQKPNIRINKKGLTFLTLFKPNHEVSFLYKQIANITLESKTGAKNLTLQWFIHFDLLDGGHFERLIIPMKYGDFILNEKQIFNLIKQAFDQKTPTLTNITMNFNDKVNSEYIKNELSLRMKLFGLIIIIAIIFSLLK